jgi:hypothetical protein
MKLALRVFVFACFALLSLTVSQLVCSVSAAPFFSGIDITSPTNSTYTDNVLALNVSASTIGGSNIFFSMNYTIDDIYADQIPLTLSYPRNSIMIAQHNGSVVLPNLPEGTHKIVVYANYTYPTSAPNTPPTPESSYYNSTVIFTINNSPTLTATPTPLQSVSPTIVPSPTPTPTTEPSPTPSPSVAEFSSFLLVPFLMATTLLGLTYCKLKQEKKK